MISKLALCLSHMSVFVFVDAITKTGLSDSMNEDDHGESSKNWFLATSNREGGYKKGRKNLEAQVIRPLTYSNYVLAVIALSLAWLCTSINLPSS